ncbi:MAG: HRDC domain-containing protein [Desulfobacterales bacterium]|nr:HRDC domain-containing protein [Desulfobacterales bacterium]
MNSISALNYRVINTALQLQEAVKLLETEKTVAFDLEADSMYHYKEKVCLIQMAAGHTVILIDPLAVPDLSPLKPVFANPDIRKVLHGADYDIRSLYRDFHIKINHLFDTQLASRFLGAVETGLDAVLTKRFNVKLEKKYQKKDWSRRPLPPEMMAYAARDVLYLIPLAKILEEELIQKDRLFWVVEENRVLSKVRPNSTHHEPLYLNFKGAGRLSPRELGILEALLLFRRTVAAKKDRPLFKVLGNPTLLSIVKNRPETVQGLERVQPLSAKQIGIYGRDLIEKVTTALTIPAENLPRYPRQRVPMLKPAVRKRVKVLNAWRETVAAQLALDPALICSKGLMVALARLNPRTPPELENITEMKNWQKKMFGKEIVAVLKKAGK